MPVVRKERCGGFDAASRVFSMKRQVYRMTSHNCEVLVNRVFGGCSGVVLLIPVSG
jgi:hypothetical protein